MHTRKIPGAYDLPHKGLKQEKRKKTCICTHALQPVEQWSLATESSHAASDGTLHEAS